MLVRLVSSRLALTSPFFVFSNPDATVTLALDLFVRVGAVVSRLSLPSASWAWTRQSPSLVDSPCPSSRGRTRSGFLYARGSFLLVPAEAKGQHSQDV